MSAGRCACGKTLERKTVATKTKKAGKHVIVEAQEQALVCAACGVIAFQPRPVQPYVTATTVAGQWTDIARRSGLDG